MQKSHRPEQSSISGFAVKWSCRHREEDLRSASRCRQRNGTAKEADVKGKRVGIFFREKNTTRTLISASGNGENDQTNHREPAIIDPRGAMIPPKPSPALPKGRASASMALGGKPQKRQFINEMKTKGHWMRQRKAVGL